MPRFRLLVAQVKVYRLDVEAETEGVAHAQALRLSRRSLQEQGTLTETSKRVLEVTELAQEEDD